MGQAKLSVWCAQLVSTLKRDPKKTGVLVVLVAVLVVMSLRTYGPGKSRPAIASGAASPASQAGSAKNPLITQSARAANLHPKLQKWAQGAVSPLSRNLFAVRLEYFPVEGPRNGAGVTERTDDGFWAKLEKSLILQADQRDKRENQIAYYRAQAAQLKLQSTIMGPQPKAMMNGELVGEGDVVASFRVRKIEARRVIVEREGIMLEIQMR